MNRFMPRFQLFVTHPSAVVFVALLAVSSACDRTASADNAPAPAGGPSSAATASVATIAGMWDLRADRPESFDALSKRYGKLHMLSGKQGASRFSVQLKRDDRFVTAFFRKRDGNFLWLESDSEGVCAASICVGDKLSKLPPTFPKACDVHENGQILMFTCPVAGTPMLIEVFDQGDALQMSGHPAPKTVPSKTLADAKLPVGALIWLAPGASWQPARISEEDGP
jgi:hypothetical protein